MPFNRLALQHPDKNRWRGLSAVTACLCLLLVCAFLPAYSAFAQNKVLGSATLQDSTSDMPLGKYAIIQSDPDGKITPDLIRSSNGSVLNGKLSDNDMIYLGYGGKSTWVSVKLFNDSIHRDWIIDVGRRIEGRVGLIHQLSVYELTVGAPNPDGTPSISLVENMPTQERGVYKVSIERKTQKLILFHIRAAQGMPMIVPLRIYSEGNYLHHVQERAMLTTSYSLFLGGFALFFFAMSIVRSRKSFLLYGTYFAFSTVTWLMYDYYGAMIGSTALPSFIMLMMLGYALFAVFITKVFCNIGYASFTERYILYGLAWLNIISTLLSFALPRGGAGGMAHVALLNGAPIATFAIICMMSFAQARSGQIPSYRYFLSWLFPLIGYITTTLTIYNFLPHNALLLSAFWYFIPLQGLFLLMACQQKMDNAEEEKFISGETLNLSRLKETKDVADHSRLLKVIEKEREMLAEFRTKEASRTEEMRIAKEAADEANRAKSAFLAVVSHEIRTPMTGIMGMVRLLMDSNISKQQRDYVMTIQESSEAMLALLNDILDFEKIQRGKIELENISFDLHRLIQGVVTLMSGHAAEKGISLSARMDDDLPKYVKGDPTRLRQVLLNLMGNGIKFTDKGSVTLFVKNLNPTDASAAQSVSTATEKYMIYFSVQDTGIGISPDAQKNLFSPFAQANSSIARKFGGSGLGLAISKGLIERMGSSVNINSKDGEGSTFFFTLDMDKGISTNQEQPKKTMAELAAQMPAQPLKILVVDDNAITRKVIAGFLEGGRHTIVGCGSAEEALTKIYGDAFDLVLMDIELPGMKGNEATKLLREYGDPVKSQLPVIAMTGNIAREDMETYLVDGMSGFIGKPIDPDKLRGMVNEIAAKSFEREIKAPGTQVPVRHESFPLPPQAPAQGQPAMTHVTEAPVHEGVFNPDMLQSLKDTIGAHSLTELLGDLIVKTEEILAAMDMAAQVGDMTALAARAHELKGMAGNFGLVEISSIAAQAEKKAKAQETDGILSLVAELPDANLRAQDALKHWVTH